MTETPPQLIEFILKSQSIQYALFDNNGLLLYASGELGMWLSKDVVAGQSLSQLLPELSGMTASIRSSIQSGKNVEINHVARPNWHKGSGYMSLQFLPFEDKILLLVKDTSALGNEEQRLMQRRNELALLNERLEKKQSQLLNITTRFVPKQVFEALIKNRKTPTITGSHRNATIVFADLRGFSRWSQEREPEDVFRVINQLLGQAVQIAAAQNGTLDKFLGDGFMALFNAPHNQPDHIQRAVQFAKEICQLESDGLRFGVGVHSGTIIAGNIGADQAMNYTALGHTVNQAKRLEESAPPGEVLMTEIVAQNIRDLYQTEFYDNLKLDGLKDPVTVYRLAFKKD
ncbi:MAG: adenylate/guanylate cyclase domain-containing protein [Anaerolineales bacterium]|nr:adenylate/guanylate cyclase domain-containing protein [Anaerolineales bacterium]